MKDKANKGYWQRLAKIYAPLMESDKKFYNAICGYIRDYLKSDMNVLELACGTGQLSFPLSDCTNSWTATDFSENMIKQACRAGKFEFMEEMNMKNYKILSKAILAICSFGIILTIINSFTGFINSSISTSGSIICISSFIVAGVAIMLLENRRIKTVKRDR